MPEIGLIDWYESRPDTSFAQACYEWEYWNGDLVDETLESRGCPYYQNMEFPVFAKLGIPVILGFLVPFGTFRYLKGSAARAAKLRGIALEKYLPYAASYTAAMAAANATPHKIFKSLALNGDIYGEIAYDSAMIYRDVSLLGYDLLTAMKMAVDRAASPWMTEFFQGMVGTLTAGGSLKLYFLNRAEHYMRENRTRLHEFLESLAMLAESYVVVAVAMPLFLIVMLVIMFWVSGAGAQMEESTLYLVVLLVLPMIHAMFAFIVWSSSEEQKM
jgi:flagellar protein FlaJ